MDFMHLLSSASARATAEGVPPLSFPRICHSPRDWLHASLKTGLETSLSTHGTIEVEIFETKTVLASWALLNRASA